VVSVVSVGPVEALVAFLGLVASIALFGWLIFRLLRPSRRR